jgi:hypothetical protein
MLALIFIRGEQEVIGFIITLKVQMIQYMSS